MKVWGEFGTGGPVNIYIYLCVYTQEWHVGVEVYG